MSPMATRGTMLFVHSPLVGPSTWVRTAGTAERRGWLTVVPDATDTVSGPSPRSLAFVERFAHGATGAAPMLVIVGHSGAGVFLPAIEASVGAPSSVMVFVDATLPPISGAHRPGESMAALLDAHTEDGILAPWLDWWPVELVTSMLPDAELRAALRADMPRVPRSLYDEPVRVPPDWSDRPCAYLRTSPAYDLDFEEAGRRGWPRAGLEGTHLSIVTEPDAVLDGIEALLETPGMAGTPR